MSGSEEGAVEDLVVSPSPERRVGEFGIGVLWAIFCLMNFFPPSGQALAPWLFGPLSALASLNFMRRAFDSRPRLIVDSEGITDRAGPFGGTLFVPWSEIVDVSLRWDGVGVVVRDVAVVRRRAGVMRRIWMRLEQALGVRTVSIILPMLSVGKPELKKRLEAGLLRFERRELGLSAGPRVAEPKDTWTGGRKDRSADSTDQRRCESNQDQTSALMCGMERRWERRS